VLYLFIYQKRKRKKEEGPSKLKQTLKLIKALGLTHIKIHKSLNPPHSFNKLFFKEKKTQALQTAWPCLSVSPTKAQTA
jgi:hypothetical protein